MNNEDFCNIVEWEGWFYALTEIKAHELEDVAAGEALQGIQEALRFLANTIPELDLNIPYAEDELELDFEQ